MKKFIVTQSRRVIKEVTGSVEIAKDYVEKDYVSYGILVDGLYVAEGLTEDEAKNQLLLIADFLNRKNTINDAVYFMPVLKQKTKNIVLQFGHIMRKMTQNRIQLISTLCLMH